MLTGARFVKALINRNLLPLWELGAGGGGLPSPPSLLTPTACSVQSHLCYRLLLSCDTWSGAKGMSPVGTEHGLRKKEKAAIEKTGQRALLTRDSKPRSLRQPCPLNLTLQI